ncbi:hypothetical protein ASC84_00690 [Acinetobacter sp. Root1280]|uniref:hypothetical protein n=1 Tax=Acinetobacter sp. Root1280 TaxID=1736444 RepID=UPI0007002EFA|nr:hypothetical protein [Acinetobacter sp. Root1280]KQX03254.1 hypothetical protein ASC84_00690 [Acinetobacter sp. Root1280]
MSFKPLERLSYAQELNQSEKSNELHFRCVIHQAYYSALNQLQYEIDNRLFFDVDGDDRYTKSHKALIEACENQVKKLHPTDSRVKLLFRIVNNMRRAKRMRETADYHIESNVDNVTAKTTIQYVQEIFDCLEQYE